MWLACLPVLFLLGVSMVLVHPDWSIEQGQFGWLLLIVFGTIALAGAGKDFCSGADLSALRRLAAASAMENVADVDELARLSPGARAGVLRWIEAGGRLLVDSAPGQAVPGLPDSVVAVGHRHHPPEAIAHAVAPRPANGGVQPQKLAHGGDGRRGEGEARPEAAPRERRAQRREARS